MWRVAAADGANVNVPWVQRLGIATLIVGALATLFVTLQGKMRPVEFDDKENRLQWKFRASRAQGTIDDEIYVAFG